MIFSHHDTELKKIKRTCPTRSCFHSIHGFLTDNLGQDPREGIFLCLAFARTQNFEKLMLK